MTEHTEDNSQPTENATKGKKYGEKTIVGRVVGRNKTVIPEQQVAQLAQIHCTNKEMADFFGVPLQTFVDNFRDIITKNKELTKQRLRKAQLDLALDKHDKTMLIWLGKNILSQQESPIGEDSSQVLPWNIETPEVTEETSNEEQ
tara:strand:- start:884 stop:1318 length:435 start_codon:yes stop_codon:yes gene_type:complete